MASQITHIVLAEALYTKLFSKFRRGKFYAGNIFPDIRYLGVIQRATTHPDVKSIQHIINMSDPFMAGINLHALMDHVREAFISSRKLYSLCPKSDYRSQTLKIYEDERFYPKIRDWDRIISEIEYDNVFNIDAVKLNSWYDSMKNYFSVPPTDETRKEMISKVGFPQDISDKINSDIAIIRDNQEVNEALDEFYSQIYNLVSNVQYS